MCDSHLGGCHTNQFTYAIRRALSSPVSEWLIQSPRILARVVYILLPLWLTYGSDQKWTFRTLLACYLVAAAYKVWGDQETSWARQLIFDKAAAGSLKQLQALINGCEDKDSLETIQLQILTIIEDKTKDVLLERTEGTISANLMVFDETERVLHLTLFSRHTKDRLKINVPLGALGAGKAIQDMKTIYTRDVKSPELKGIFREDAPYRSILSIPIACDHRKVGVVNVDATRPNAFEVKSLEDHLAPYVQLIGLSICLGGAAHANTEQSSTVGRS
jgi:hypothetical protein